MTVEPDAPTSTTTRTSGCEAVPFEGGYQLKTEPNEVQINLQRVDHPSRVHLDLETDDIEAEVRRLEGNVWD